MLRVIFAAVAIGLTALWLFVWRAPIGVRDQWLIAPNDAAWPAGAWLLPVGVVAIFGGAAALSVYDRFKRAKSRKEQTNSTVTALVCLAVIGLIWPWALLGPGQIQNRAATANIKLTLEGRFNIIAAMWSDVTTEYFGAAYLVDDARAYTRTYAQTQQNPISRAQAHVAAHPPGAVLWFYGARKLYESSPALQSGLTELAQTMTGQTQDESAKLAQSLREVAARGVGAPDPPPLPPSAIGAALGCAILLGLSLVAALPAVYGLAALGGGAHAERRGLVAAALWILAPTTNLFAFTLDALVACGAAWTLYFAALAWQRNAAELARAVGKTGKSKLEASEVGAGLAWGSNPSAKQESRLEPHASPAPAPPKSANFWWFASGVTLALTTFLSIGALAVGAILVGALLLYRPRGAGRALLLGGGAFILVWLLLSLWGGFNPFAIALQAGKAHRFATLQTRSYWPWVWLNLAMWLPFIGWPVVALLAQSVKLGNERAKPARVNAQMEAAGVCFGVATLGVLVLLCLSGNVRGEVERLWLFALAPVCVLAARHDALRLRAWALLLALQAVQTLLMAATLAPLVRPF